MMLRDEIPSLKKQSLGVICAVQPPLLHFGHHTFRQDAWPMQKIRQMLAPFIVHQAATCFL